MQSYYSNPHQMAAAQAAAVAGVQQRLQYSSPLQGAAAAAALAGGGVGAGRPSILQGIQSSTSGESNAAIVGVTTQAGVRRS